MSPAIGRYALRRGRADAPHYAGAEPRTRRGRAAHSTRYVGAPWPREPKPRRAEATLRWDRSRGSRAWPRAGMRARGLGRVAPPRHGRGRAASRGGIGVGEGRKGGEAAPSGRHGHALARRAAMAARRGRTTRAAPRRGSRDEAEPRAQGASARARHGLGELGRARRAAGRGGRAS
jgi:hypothetical protein